MIIPEEYDKLHPAPFSLFCNSDGLWETKDANGKIYDSPVYYRIEEDDGDCCYSDRCSTVCSFSEKNGMEVIVWSEPWYYTAFLVADYPEQYNHYIGHHIKERTILDENVQFIPKIGLIVDLTEKQRVVIEELDFYCREKDKMIVSSEHDEGEEWCINHSSKLTPKERVEVVLPLLESDSIDDDLKSLLWFALFKFNDWYDCIRYNPEDNK